MSIKDNHDIMSSSDESQDTDTTDEMPTVKHPEISYWAFLPFLHFTIPYACVYIIWYFFNRNLLLLIFYFYVMVPIIDMALPLDQKNLKKKEIKAYEKDPKFLIPLYAYWAADFFSYFWGLYLFVYEDFNSKFEKGLLLMAVFHIGSVGMVAGHELLHRKSLVHKIFGTSFYFKALYSHFLIEHTKGHHKNVATPMDPATSKFGETLYQFLPRTISGSYKSVWEYEKKRLARKKAPEGPWSLNNRLILFNIGHVVFLTTLAYIFGYQALIFSIVYAGANVFFLETINYLEHYGLERKDENGCYEGVSIKHSWNAPQRYTNYVLFKLQRHSDHHANVYKPYQILCSYQDSPTLPSGYSATLLTAVVPWVWFKAIDPLVKANREERYVTKEEEEASKKIINTYLFGLTTVIVIIYFTITSFLI